MLELAVLLLLSIITARFLERRYHVASVAHAILFVLLLAVTLFTTDIPFIKAAMMNWMGELYYNSLYDALHDTVTFVNIGLSAIIIVEITVFVLVPLLSIVAIIEEIREQLKEMKVKVDFSAFIPSFINLVDDPKKDFRHTENEIYLVLGKLLN